MLLGSVLLFLSIALLGLAMYVLNSDLICSLEAAREYTNCVEKELEELTEEFERLRFNLRNLG